MPREAKQQDAPPPTCSADRRCFHTASSTRLELLVDARTTLFLRAPTHAGMTSQGAPPSPDLQGLHKGSPS